MAVRTGDIALSPRHMAQVFLSRYRARCRRTPQLSLCSVEVAGFEEHKTQPRSEVCVVGLDGESRPKSPRGLGPPLGSDGRLAHRKMVFCREGPLSDGSSNSLGLSLTGPLGHAHASRTHTATTAFFKSLWHPDDQLVLRRLKGRDLLELDIFERLVEVLLHSRPCLRSVAL